MIDFTVVESIFLAALERPSFEARAAYLDEKCGADAELRKQVEKLLNADPQVADLLDRPVVVDGDAMASVDVHPKTGVGTVDQPVPANSSGTIVAGRYKLLEEIAEGGMGTVWMAEQREPVKRLVALKLIKLGMDSKAILARFEAERQALAMMDHPNIARILDGGTTGHGPGESAIGVGRPYFVMELVKGLPLIAYCDSRRLSVRDRLGLFVQICSAVQHAHQKGVIHRDLKPTNVLVTEHDGKPVPKVIDFGLAKALYASQMLTEHTLHTAYGTVVGTPLYMAPEQVSINALDVDTRSDIYALGVILYELLTGTTPLEKRRFKEAAWDEVKRLIREEEPPKPSMRLSSSDALPSLAAQRQMEPTKLSRLLRGELDWIVMKALEKDRNRRYETANGFAMDVKRYLADEQVLACPPSMGYRLKKFLRKNRQPVIAASVVLSALLVGMVGTTFGLIRSEAARREAELAQSAEARRAEGERIAKGEAIREKAKAEQAEAETLANYRETTEDAIEQLSSSKSELGPKERAYLENTLKRWEAFANRQGDDQRSRVIRAEGHYRVGSLWQTLGHKQKARLEFQAARDLQKNLVEQFPAVPEYQQDLAGTHNSLGSLLAGLREEHEARVEYQAAHDLLTKLGERFPASPEYQRALAGIHNNLGTLLVGLGKGEEARAEFEAAHDIRQKLVQRFPLAREFQQELATIHNNLGNLLDRLGKREKAQAEYQAARNIQKKLVDKYPDVLAYQQALARTHYNLGMMFQNLEKREEARVEYVASRDLQRTLVEQVPAVPVYQQELANTHHNLGLLLADLRKHEEARTEYETARDLQKKLVERFPADPEYLYQLAGTHNDLGNLEASLQKCDEARAEYRMACDYQRRLVQRFPIVLAYQIELGNIYCNCGTLILNDGKPDESVQWFDLAIRTLKLVHEKEQDDLAAKQLLRNSHMGRARAYDRLQKRAEAVKDWDCAIDLGPPAEQVHCRTRRAISQIQAGAVAEAMANVAELTINPNLTADQWYDCACVYSVASDKIAAKRTEYGDRALDLLKRAVKAGWKNGVHMETDADLDPLRSRVDFKKLLAELDKKSPTATANP